MFTDEIGGDHLFDGAEVEGVCADPDHGDVEGREDGEGAGDAGLLTPVVHRAQAQEGGSAFAGHPG